MFESNKQKIPFLVRVSCMTFNHAPYIEDAMNGFTMQQTDFPFVCTIMDDASTDGEPEVIKKYLLENFDLEDTATVRKEETDDYVMTFARHKTNHNCHFAVYFLKYNHNSIKKSKAPYIKEWQDQVKYIAICEGDDYWVDSLKLQKQVFFLVTNPDYGLVWGKANIYYQKQHLSKGTVGKFASDFKELLKDNAIVTLTATYRLELQKEYRDFVGNKQWLMSDKPLWLYIASKSKIHFQDEVFGVYRVLEHSASMRDSYEGEMLFAESSFDCQEYFATRLMPSMVSTIRNSKYINFFEISFQNNKYRQVIKYYNSIEKPGFKRWLKYTYVRLMLFFGL